MALFAEFGWGSGGWLAATPSTGAGMTPCRDAVISPEGSVAGLCPAERRGCRGSAPTSSFHPKEA